MDYKKSIHELIEKIKSEKILKRIYNYVQYLWKHQED